MFNAHREEQFAQYNAALGVLERDPRILISIEQYVADQLLDFVNTYRHEIIRDFNEASYLYPFWQNYPPDDRGRSPRRDQYPWIEVGEHVLGAKLSRFVASRFDCRDTGLPTGTDERYVIGCDKIEEMTDGLTRHCWLFVDIKSVGPRDDQDHTVMSHNQVSGSGHWAEVQKGVRNDVMKATGKRASHDFHCSIPPIYVLSDGTTLPVILTALKPVYRMLSLEGNDDGGQPIGRIAVVSIPNGILLERNPGYLASHPGLLFPGKDDRGKNPLKVRSRVDFATLRSIASWRVRDATMM